jgi:hypothetical protein
MRRSSAERRLVAFINSFVDGLPRRTASDGRPYKNGKREGSKRDEIVIKVTAGCDVVV